MKNYPFEVVSGDFRSQEPIKRGTLHLRQRPAIGESVKLTGDDEEYKVVNIIHTDGVDTEPLIVLEPEGGGVVRARLDK